MASCYNLNGRQSPFDGNTHVPCNMTAVEAGGHSTCCPIGDMCLTNGMCKNVEDEKKNWYWRTACTDKTWQDPACPRYCESIEPTRNTGLVFNCLKKESWCCAYVGGSLQDWKSRADINTTCCAIDDLTFTAEDPIVYATATNPIKVSTQSTSTSQTSTFLSSISLATTATQADQSSLPTTDGNASPGGQSGSSGLSTGAKVGLGVGIPLGVIGLAAIGAFFWLRRRRNAGASNITPEVIVSTAHGKESVPPYHGTATNQHGATVYRHEAPSPQMAHELPVPVEPFELPPQVNPSK